MGKIRILIVDDSVVIRRLLSEELSRDPRLEVVGVAASGKMGLTKIPQVNPDVVTMDIEMPEMDGLTAVSEIRKTHSRLPIIMFSTLSQRGARETLEALSRGANDYVTKPANAGSALVAMQRVREELIPKILSLCPKLAAQPSQGASSKMVTRSPKRPSGPQRIDIVTIGVSTGGPNALAEVLSLLPREFPVPIVIVQHMPPVFTQCLADRLSAKCNIDVREGAAGDVLHPGAAWIAPGDFHMELARNGTNVEVALHQGPPENSCRPAADVLFRSVSQMYGPHALGVVLTGMGQDGLRGCEAIRERGGAVVVQDEATSVVWGMPGAVAQAELADRIVPLGDIASVVQRMTDVGRAAMAAV